MTVIVNHRTPLVVPPAVRKQAGFKSGDKLEFRVTGHVVTIVSRTSASDDGYTPAQRRAIDRGITESEKQYAAGKSYGPFDTPAEAMASINANLRKRRAGRKLKSPGR